MRTIAAILLAAATAVCAAPPATIALPPPDTKTGMPLMQALAKRHSTREFAAKPLPLDVLSNLLWAADGVNRPDGHRTAPSAMNWQTVDVYVVLPDAAYLYNAKDHRLELVAAGDLRPLTGRQPFPATAPLNLVYVSDFAKMRGVSDADRLLYGGAETGFIGQNAYLYCASAGLNTVVRAMIDRDALAKPLRLRPDQRITLSQTVGYPR